MFSEEQRVRSKVTGNKGVVHRAMELIAVQFDNGERCMIGGDLLEVIPPDDGPPPVASAGLIFKQDDEVICVNPLFSNGLTARVLSQEGGKVWVVWHKHHWKYAGQLDGQYSADSFQHWHPSTVSDAA